MADNALIKYEADGQEISLDPMTVRKYLVNGGGNVSDQEVMMFMQLCKAQKLNPYIRDAHLVKYGGQPASIIVGKDAFTKRAEANADYAGKKAGIIVINLKKDVEYREGTFYLGKGREELVGGWAKVLFKSGKESELSTVSIDEYLGRKKDGSINSMWSTKPATMIRKVAVVQALREAFPSGLSQLYIEEEMGIDEDLPQNHIDPEAERMKEFHVDEPEPMASKIEKQQIMQLAAEKGLMIGTGKDADITKLLDIAAKHNVSLKKMTSSQAKNLIFVLNDYEPENVVDVSPEDVKPVEEQYINKDNKEPVEEPIKAQKEQEDNNNEINALGEDEIDHLAEGDEPF